MTLKTLNPTRLRVNEVICGDFSGNRSLRCNLEFDLLNSYGRILVNQAYFGNILALGVLSWASSNQLYR